MNTMHRFHLLFPYLIAAVCWTLAAGVFVWGV